MAPNGAGDVLSLSSAALAALMVLYTVALSTRNLTSTSLIFAVSHGRKFATDGPQCC